jgi:hypothetical protein
VSNGDKLAISKGGQWPPGNSLSLARVVVTSASTSPTGEGADLGETAVQVQAFASR